MRYTQDRTLGELVSTKASQAKDATLNWVSEHRYGIGIGIAATTIYALYQGFQNPIPEYMELSNPNFVKPGEDVQWQGTMAMFGIVHSAISNYVSNWYMNAGAIVAGGLGESVIKKIGSIKIKE